MSFMGTTHRSYDPLSHPDLTHIHRNSVSALDAFDNVAQPPMHPPLHQPQQHPHHHQSHLADRSRNSLPEIGQTRCYWALLNADLRFLYLDPVLAHHLRDQASDLIGKSLLHFVHPDEQTSAEQDLGGVLESRTLHGSVTRVRFSRLSRVRRELGARGSPVGWSDAEKIAVDEHYMAVDIVINWAADDVVLCFIHAVVDLEPRDNDEYHKTGWTNWCGTPYMSQDEVNLLFQRLYHALPTPTGMDRVFQILLNQPERPLLCSWPPDRQQGGPISKEFVKLAAEVNLGTSSSSSEAKTSCTRRYKAQQTMSYGADSYRDVESIFIPYGSIIFACHKVEHPNSHKAGNGYMQHQSSQYYDPAAYNLPPLNVPSDYPAAAYTGEQQPPSHYSQQNWSGSDGSQQPYSQWNSQHAHISSSPSVSSMRSSSYQSSQQQDHQHASQQHHWPAHPPASAYMEPNGAPGYFPTGVHYPNTPSVGTPASENAPSAADDVVPVPRTGRRSTKEHFSGNRAAGNPPVGIMKCSSCKVTQSPEWRKGPSGKKDLCNACGLRFARSRAKKDGAAARRRKDKVLAAMSNKSDHSTPSLPPISIPFNGMRRGSGYDENSNGPAAPVLDGYPPMPHQAPPHAPQGPGYNGVTPSPPPSGSQSSFVACQQPPHPSSQPEQQHASQAERGPGHYMQPYYNLATPVSASVPAGGSPGSLPRLDPMGGLAYPHRVSHSPPSPMPPAPHFNQPSYERERHQSRDRDRMVLPPTPVSAEHRTAPGKF